MANTEYKLDFKHKVVYSKVTDKISADEFIEHINTIRADPHFHKSFNIITDFSNAAIDHSFDQASTVATYIIATKGIDSDCKLAIITGKLSSAWTGVLMTIAGISDLRATISSFDNMKNAKEWIITPKIYTYCVEKTGSN